MSFNGRLNPILNLSQSSDAHSSMTLTSFSNLSLSSDLVSATSLSPLDAHAALCERLATCQSALASKERRLRRLREQQDEQLASVCRQMMAFECGLRRKQRELEVAIRQKDKIIREQNLIIRFLMGKTGAKTRNIAQLRNEAVAKIPQIVPAEDESSAAAASTRTVVEVMPEPGPHSLGNSGDVRRRPVPSVAPQLHLTTIRLSGVGGGEQHLTSIMETASENGGDSDSAIILDDSATSSSTPSSTSSSMKSGSTMGGGNGAAPADKKPQSEGLLQRKAASTDSRSSDDRGPSLRRSRSRLKRISRSVSDVMTAEDDAVDEDDEKAAHSDSGGSAGELPKSGRVVRLVDDNGDDEELSEDYSTVEEEEEAYSAFEMSNYRGFLLRHGSFERYKSRAKEGSDDVVRESAGTGAESPVVTVVSSCSSASSCSPSPTASVGSRQIPSINHRSVTKPRDVKNRNNSSKARIGGGVSSGGAGAGSARPLNNSSSAAVSESIRNFVEKRGSVYRSVFLDSTQPEIAHSFA